MPVLQQKLSVQMLTKKEYMKLTVSETGFQFLVLTGAQGDSFAVET